jgi:putative transcriptional regulator
LHRSANSAGGGGSLVARVPGFRHAGGRWSLHHQRNTSDEKMHASDPTVGEARPSNCSAIARKLCVVQSALQGHFLIATPQLVDRNFARAVVLIVRHGEDGALGMVINRPLDAKLSTIWDQVSESPCRLDHVLHHGGPCEGPLMVLHTDYVTSESTVLDGVNFSADRERIEQIVSEETPDATFFVGYAGWSVGQLEGEIAEGSWLVMPAVRQQIFGDKEGLWDLLYRRAHRAKVFPWLDPKRIPDDPNVN